LGSSATRRPVRLISAFCVSLEKPFVWAGDGLGLDKNHD
jgi:hypothetical protein